MPRPLAHIEARPVPRGLIGLSWRVKATQVAGVTRWRPSQLKMAV
ncbi:MAG: hypothetical protein RL357_622 [Pseudomonadota bacterium]